MEKRIGLFGGTFDPVHNGHISIAHSFLNSNQLTELWVLLTPYPPHKRDANQASYQLRYEMLKEAFSGIDNLNILTIENELPKPSFSFNTIQHLKETNPNTEFYFCIGEDNLSKFNTWKHHKEILNEAKLMVAQRPGENHFDVDDYILEKTIFVEHNPINASSTQIKESLLEEEQLEKLIPKKVLDIIKREALYKSNV